MIAAVAAALFVFALGYLAYLCDPNYTFVAKLRKRYLPERTLYGGMHARLRDVGRAYLAERR